MKVNCEMNITNKKIQTAYTCKHKIIYQKVFMDEQLENNSYRYEEFLQFHSYQNYSI